MSKEDAFNKALEVTSSGQCCRHLKECLNSGVCYFSSKESVGDTCKCQDYRAFSVLKNLLND